VHVCDVRPCVIVVRDSVIGHAPALVCGVRPCVIVVRGSVIGHDPACPQRFGRRHSLRLKQIP